MLFKKQKKQRMKPELRLIHYKHDTFYLKLKILSARIFYFFLFLLFLISLCP